MADEHTQRDRWFTTTRWTVVLGTADSDPERAADALRQLCETYWYPLYSYVRHRGHSIEDAEDLTQGFFERLLGTGDPLPSVQRNREPFRAFLLAAMKHFLANEPGSLDSTVRWR